MFPEVEILKVFEEAKKKEIEEKGATSHYGEHQGITCGLSSVLKCCAMVVLFVFPFLFTCEIIHLNLDSFTCGKD